MPRPNDATSWQHPAMDGKWIEVRFTKSSVFQPPIASHGDGFFVEPDSPWPARRHQPPAAHAMNPPTSVPVPDLPVGTLPFSSCEDAVHVLTHLYMELQLPLPLAVLAARADCRTVGVCSGDEEDNDADDDCCRPSAPPAVETPTVKTESAATLAEAKKSPAPFGLVVAAFAAVYVIWGSTYLGIRIAIETIPPLLMAGVRFLTAGVLLFGVMRLRGVPVPRGVQWRSALIVGALLLLAGNGGVSWAEQRVPSGLTALLIATVPLWMIVLDWLRPGGGGRPRPAVFGGLAMGFAGVAVIVLTKDSTGHRAVDPVGVAVLLGASFCWAVGSVYSKGMPQASHPLMSVAAQMLCGGGLMLVCGLISGEASGFHLQAVSRASLLALVYLVLIGALVGFTAYVWLLRVSTPARVSTYAYVNPLIAVLLGASIGHEAVSGGILLAGSLIIGAVVLITTSRARATKAS